MTRNIRTRRGMTIGVERLDQRLSPSSISPFAVHYTPMATVGVQLPHGVLPPTTPGAATVIPINSPYFILRR